MDQIALPKELADLFVVLSNPLVAPVWLSMILEQLPFIKNPLTADWKKVVASVIAGLVWAVFIVIGNPSSNFTFNAAGLYSIVRAGLGVAFLMNVFNQSIYNAFPWLKDFLLVLFQRTTVVNTVAVKTDDSGVSASSSSSSKTTVSAGTSNTAEGGPSFTSVPGPGAQGVGPDIYAGITADQG